MDASCLTARDLFDKQVRYVIPDFQRPYVWVQDDQWEPLWSDVQHAGERYLEELRAIAPDGEHDGAMRAKAQQAVGRHFLGAVVVKQRLHAASELEAREVIDSQQRLTTIQLLLDAAEQVAREREWEDLSEQLTDLVLNKQRYARDDADLRFKVWPTSTDRAAFRAVMDNDTSSSEHRSTQVAKGHDYFRARIGDWLDRDDAPGEPVERMDALATALIALLELVVIDLGAEDDAFVIFETLNARGTPLSASDLVKNALLAKADQLGVPTERITADYWSAFDDKWWKKEIRQGRLRRERLDVFLDYWLESHTTTEVASHEVFPRFKRLLDDDPATLHHVAQRVHDRAATYRVLESRRDTTPEGTFLYRWAVMDAGVLTPLLLWVFGWSESELSADRRRRLLTALESYLVRRMACRMTTKQYNRLFLDVLGRLQAEGPSRADEVLIDALATQKSESQLWPSDAALREAFLDREVYRLLTRARVRMVLEALEDHHRGPKSEDEHVVRGKLTVEHVLPQQWRTHWPLPGRQPAEVEAIERNRLLHSFGNLTLATSSLNSSMSNHAFDDKRAHLMDNSTLHLNKRVLDRAGQSGAWDEDSIRARSVEMFGIATQLWPRPGAVEA